MPGTKNYPKSILLTCTLRQYSAWRMEARERKVPLVRWVRFALGREVRRMQHKREAQDLARVPLPPTGT